MKQFSVAGWRSETSLTLGSALERVLVRLGPCSIASLPCRKKSSPTEEVCYLFQWLRAVSASTYRSSPGFSSSGSDLDCSPFGLETGSNPRRPAWETAVRLQIKNICVHGGHPEHLEPWSFRI